MRAASRIWLALLSTFLTACATSSAPIQDSLEPAPEVVESWEEGCEDERSLVLLCRDEGDECGFFRCQEVVPREVLLAYRGGGPISTGASPAAPRRWWGYTGGWPRNNEPVLTFRFNRHFDPKPPQFVLPPGRWVRHHIFPQAWDLKEWFHRQGVANIHQFTMVIPEHLHHRIHSGGPNGGLWNEAWREFKTNNPTASPAEIYRHAGALIFRFQLTGPIVPYRRGR